MRTSVSSGKDAEEHAAQELQKQGYQILERNFRVKGGEIDIIARFRAELVFVEVKARFSHTYGFPEEAVTNTKERRIAAAMREYIRRKRISDTTYVRFDVIAIEYSSADGSYTLRHLKNIELPT